MDGFTMNLTQFCIFLMLWKEYCGHTQSVIIKLNGFSLCVIYKTVTWVNQLVQTLINCIIHFKDGALHSSYIYICTVYLTTYTFLKHVKENFTLCMRICTSPCLRTRMITIMIEYVHILADHVTLSIN